ncbi:HTH-type transcriptional regulator AscG [Abditibacteriota bacterium]|nr:HTH-type transcriptional regulator AscG [Abditibacteriota bacterium]
MSEPVSPSSSPSRAPVTIHDVAAALGMHKSTVSLALSGKGNVSKETRARVAEVAAQLGYSPNPLAQRLARSTGGTFIALCSGGLDVGLGTEKILRMQKLLSRRALEAPIYTLSEVPDEEGGVRDEASRSAAQAQQMRSLCRQRPRAIVCAAPSLHPAVWEELTHYTDKGGLVVSYDVAVPFPCDQIVFDREDNAYQGARALIEAGHSSIGFAMAAGGFWPSDNPLVPQNQRIAGWKRALAEAGLEWRDEWLFVHRPYEMGGAQLASQFLALEERPTALCVVNDYVALAFMVEIMRAGIRIPEDVSLVGHDNQAVALYCPVPLSSVSQPVERIAQGVVELLMSRLEDKDLSPRRIVVQGEFIGRQSIARR